MRAQLSVLLLCLTLGACNKEESIYVQADRATYDAIAPEWCHYVLTDPDLTEQEQQRRLDLIETWGRRLLAEETLQAKMKAFKEASGK